MDNMGIADLEKAIMNSLPSAWADRVEVKDMFDADERPALEVTVIVKAEHPEVFEDGKLLNEVAEAIHEAVRVHVELWPYTRFVSADEVEAA